MLLRSRKNVFSAAIPLQLLTKHEYFLDKTLLSLTIFQYIAYASWKYPVTHKHSHYVINITRKRWVVFNLPQIQPTLSYASILLHLVNISNIGFDYLIREF